MAKGPPFMWWHPLCQASRFSSAPTEPGFGVIKTAETFNQLMLALGYPRYVAQGISHLTRFSDARLRTVLAVRLTDITPSASFQWVSTSQMKIKLLSILRE